MRREYDFSDERPIDRIDFRCPKTGNLVSAVYGPGESRISCPFGSRCIITKIGSWVHVDCMERGYDVDKHKP